jgi:hypothetical protein
VIAREAPFGFNSFTTLGVFFDADQLGRAVEASRADLFHVHNEPDWMIKVVKDHAGDRPVIYDVHDLGSLRYGEPGDDEVVAAQAADGILHVSEMCQRIFHNWHGNGKPDAVFYSMVNRQFVPDTLKESGWSSWVYEGGLSINDEEGDGLHNMRYWLPLVEQLTDRGYNVSLFRSGSDGDMGLVYENVGAFVIHNVMYPTLLNHLRNYAFGMVGALRDFPLMQAAMPNKMFEYLSQGVIPVVFNAMEAADYVTKHDVGYVWDKTLEIDANLEILNHEAERLRFNIMQKRDEFVVENQIETLVSLYEEVLK